MARRLAHVSDRYERILLGEKEALEQWCRSREIQPLDDVPVDASRVDSVLCGYIHFLHRSWENYDRAKHAILAMQHVHRELKGQLRKSWELARAWNLSLPVGMRTPMPLQIMWTLVAVCLSLAAAAGEANAARYIAGAVSLLVGFHGLLRPGELCQVRRRHCLLPDGFSLAGPVATIALENPKNRSFIGRNQVAIIRDKPTLRWLSWWMDGVGDDALLMPGGPPAFRAVLDSALAAAQLPARAFTPASLRAGGATHLFQQNVEVARIRIAGRWKSLASLDHYIQEASATTALTQLPAATATLARDVVAHGRFLRRPPEVPWTAWCRRPRSQTSSTR